MMYKKSEIKKVNYNLKLKAKKVMTSTNMQKAELKE